MALTWRCNLVVQLVSVLGTLLVLRQMLDFGDFACLEDGVGNRFLGWDERRF